MSWLSAAEAADIMRCSEQTLIKMAKEGQFPTAKWAGKKVRIHESDLRPTNEVPAPAPDIDRESVYRLVDEIKTRLNEIAGLVEDKTPVTPPALLPARLNDMVWGWTKQG